MQIGNKGLVFSFMCHQHYTSGLVKFRHNTTLDYVGKIMLLLKMKISSFVAAKYLYL